MSIDEMLTRDLSVVRDPYWAVGESLGFGNLVNSAFQLGEHWAEG